MKYIFCDLDNTLISAEYLYGNPPRDAKIVRLEGEKYWARLRPGALELLYNLRKTAPTYMLTAATREYALGWNKEFKLGFKEEDVYSREDTDYIKLTVGEKFPEKGNTYLIDDKDLPFENTVVKVNFLSGLGEVKVIQIKSYAGHANQSLGEVQIANILSKIV